MTHSFPTRRSSELFPEGHHLAQAPQPLVRGPFSQGFKAGLLPAGPPARRKTASASSPAGESRDRRTTGYHRWLALRRSEEHTSELRSLMRISYAVFCLKKKKQNNNR